MARRSDVVGIARGLIGTPFGHQGRTPGTMLDCVGVPLVIAESLHIKDIHGKPILSRDDCRYGRQPQSDIVYERCKARLQEIDELREGCVLALKSSSVACHSAIATKVQGNWYMIHADFKMGKVTETPLTDFWIGRIKGRFDFPGIIDG